MICCGTCSDGCSAWCVLIVIMQHALFCSIRLLLYLFMQRLSSISLLAHFHVARDVLSARATWPTACVKFLLGRL